MPKSSRSDISRPSYGAFKFVVEFRNSIIPKKSSQQLQTLGDFLNRIFRTDSVSAAKNPHPRFLILNFLKRKMGVLRGDERWRGADRRAGFMSRLEHIVYEVGLLYAHWTFRNLRCPVWFGPALKCRRQNHPRTSSGYIHFRRFWHRLKALDVSFPTAPKSSKMATRK